VTCDEVAASIQPSTLKLAATLAPMVVGYILGTVLIWGAVGLLTCLRATLWMATFAMRAIGRAQRKRPS
jgi:hypothetical protein